MRREKAAGWGAAALSALGKRGAARLREEGWVAHTNTRAHIHTEAEENLLLQGLHSHFLVLQLLLHLGQLLLQPGELQVTRSSQVHTQV